MRSFLPSLVILFLGCEQGPDASAVSSAPPDRETAASMRAVTDAAAAQAPPSPAHEPVVPAANAAPAATVDPATQPIVFVEAETTDETDLFTDRILPIARSKAASSCTECHFAGVELADYVGEDEASTFAALRKAGLIDVEIPDDSKLLAFIGRAPETPDPLLARVRANELQAFRAWIRSAVRDPRLLAAKSEVSLGTEVPVEVIRHARRDRVLQSFLDNVWSEMGRCVSCHNPERNRRAIGRNGRTKEDVDAISWVVPRDPLATLHRLVEDGNIDLDDPESSQLITKPAAIEEHGGGPKFLVGSTTHRNLLEFVTDFAAITGGDYEKAADLPEPPAEFVIPTEQHLRLTNVPAAYGGLPLQVDLYRWQEEDRSWSKERWGTAMNRVAGKRHLWQSIVAATAPTGSERARRARERRRLPDGRYLLKIRVDSARRTAKDHTYDLGDDEIVGEVEIRGAWKPGYQPPKVVDFPRGTAD